MISYGMIPCRMSAPSVILLYSEKQYEKKSEYWTCKS